MPALPKHTPILFISTDQSYFAELNSEKKTELTNVTQVSFPLIEDTVLHQANLTQVFGKLEQKSYYLIVDDALFFHYIADFPVKTSESLESQIANTVNSAFPDQDEPLHIVTIDLAKTSRVQTIQITAMTKQNLEILSQAASEASVTIKGLIPASFVVKAFVSIDPSLFILHTPEHFLLTSHYIGVEYAKNLSGTGDVIEALETLKTSHPHLQHAYLCADEDVHEELEKTFSEIIPTQTVKVPKVTAEADTPYFFKALCVGYKDIVENKFPYPIFELPKVSAKSTVTDSASQVSEAPELIPPVVVLEDEEEIPAISSVDDEGEEEITENVQPVSPLSSLFHRPQTEVKTTVNVEGNQVSVEKTTEKIPDRGHPTNKVSTVVTTTEAKEETVLTTKSKPRKKASIVPYIFLTFIVAGLISLIGGGIILSQQAINQRDGIESPLVEGTPAPEASPEPTPTPAPTPVPIAKDKLSILIVNATGVAGQAGKTAQTFKDAGYTNVKTGNASGDYKEDGIFLMVKDPAQAEAVLSQLNADVKLELTALEYAKTEDAKGTYDAVVVLNE